MGGVKQKMTQLLGFPVVHLHYRTAEFQDEHHPAYKNPVIVAVMPRFHYPSWRVMETGHPLTRVVETGL